MDDKNFVVVYKKKQASSALSKNKNKCKLLLILFCVLTKHLWVLKKTVKRVRAFPMELEFELANGFEERGKTGVPEEKPLGATGENQ